MDTRFKDIKVGNVYTYKEGHVSVCRCPMIRECVLVGSCQCNSDCDVVHCDDRAELLTLTFVVNNITDVGTAVVTTLDDDTEWVVVDLYDDVCLSKVGGRT